MRIPVFVAFAIGTKIDTHCLCNKRWRRLDEDKGFSGFLSEKSSITFSMGNGFRTQANLAQVLISSFEFGVPRTAIGAFPPGGAFTIQLPSGKRYTIKLPPIQAAIGHLKKCAGG